MMNPESFSISTADHHQIHVRHWPCQGQAKGILHLLHGMAEHSGRYQRLADQLTRQGWHLYAHDHRGHGLSVRNDEEQGLYAMEAGWKKVVEDVGLVQQHIRYEQPGLPIILMGHSMGSFIALQYAILHGKSLQGLILSGTDLQPGWFYRLVSLPIRMEKLRLGKLGTSRLVHALTFGSFSKQVKGRKTEYDWLSRDPQSVRNYIEDPFCGFDCTVQLWLDLLGGLQQIANPHNLDRLPVDLPIYIFCGGNDPMSRNGKGVLYLLKELKRSQLKNISHHIYPLGRHEMLNEINRDEVVDNLMDWLKQFSQPEHHQQMETGTLQESAP